MFSTPRKTNSFDQAGDRPPFTKQVPSKGERLQACIKDRNGEQFQKLLDSGNLTPDSFHDVFGCLLKTIEPPDRTNWTQWLLTGFDNATKRRFLENEIEIIGRNARESDADARDKVRLSEEICKTLLVGNFDLMTKEVSNTRRNIMHVAVQTNASIVIKRIRENLPRGALEDDHFHQMVLELDQNNKSAIELAIDQGHVEALQEMAGPDRAVLHMANGGKAALTETAILRKHLRIVQYLFKDDVEAITIEVISLAVKEAAIEIFEFLIQLRPSLLEQDDCYLLHEAVEHSQIEIVQRLVKLQPNLIAGFRKDPIQPTNPPRPVLSYAKKTEEGEEIYDFLLPIVIEMSEVSDIRQHLLGLSNKELCLDLSPWKDDTETLEAFLTSAHASLREKRAATSDDEPDFNTAIVSMIRSELLKRNITLEDHEILKDDELLSTIRDVRQGIGSYVNDQKRMRKGQPTQRPTSFDVEFEEILKYVQLPLLPSSASQGRPPVNLALDWLYECKGVRRIFEVRVDDSQSQPHSEEDIEKGLRRFQVTNLDWRRTDLSVYAILRAAPQVKRLHLYSSGNLGTLDHWMGQNGLRQLEKLEEVHITILTDNISLKRVKQCRWLLKTGLRRFYHYTPIPSSDQRTRPPKRRLSFRYRMVSETREPLHQRQQVRRCRGTACAQSPATPEPVKTMAPMDLVLSGPRAMKKAIIDTRQWSSTGPASKASASRIASKRTPVEMASLQYFLPFYIQEHSRQNPIAPQYQTRTRVAILDTGVGSIFFPGSERKVTGRSFVTSPMPERELESPWWLTSDPHGSQMANIIAQLDPACELFICKVAEKRSSFHISSVTKAIGWALQQGVDIINCSFVLYAENEEFSHAVRVADEKGVAIICSTADRGFVQQVVWPAWYNKVKQLSNIFPTAPCNDFGRVTEYATEKVSDFLLPGVDIDASGPGAELSDPVSGSSVATAMATGIASVIVGCCRLSAQRATNQTPKFWIRTVFERMCATDTTKDNGPRRIVPTLVFPERAPPSVGAKADSDYDLEAKSLTKWLKFCLVGKHLKSVSRDAGAGTRVSS